MSCSAKSQEVASTAREATLKAHCCLRVSRAQRGSDFKITTSRALRLQPVSRISPERLRQDPGSARTKLCQIKKSTRQ